MSHKDLDFCESLQSVLADFAGAEEASNDDSVLNLAFKLSGNYLHANETCVLLK